MKPVLQTKIGMDGNCWQACLASILELPLEVFPSFETEDTPVWYEHWQKWLEPFGLAMVCLDAPTDDPRQIVGYAILIVRREGDEITHAVVEKDGEIVHNPYPYKPGEDRGEFIPVYRIYLRSLDPAKWIDLSQLTCFLPHTESEKTE